MLHTSLFFLPIHYAHSYLPLKKRAWSERRKETVKKGVRFRMKACGVLDRGKQLVGTTCGGLSKPLHVVPTLFMSNCRKIVSVDDIVKFIHGHFLYIFSNGKKE